MVEVVWRSHPVYFQHEVSSDGRVRTIGRWVDFTGRAPRWFDGKELAHTSDTYGYRMVNIGGYGRKRNGRRARIHRLVCETFHGPQPHPGHEVRHLDGNHLDNRVENLAWGSRSENKKGAVRHGTNPVMWKTECKHGHPFTPDNTGRDTRGNRYCLECSRVSHKLSQRRRRARNRRAA